MQDAVIVIRNCEMIGKKNLYVYRSLLLITDTGT